MTSALKRLETIKDESGSDPTHRTGPSIHERLSSRATQTLLNDLYNSAGIKARNGLPGFQVQRPLLFLHDWLKAGIVMRQQGVLRYAPVHFVYLDEFLNAQGCFLARKAGFEPEFISQWMYVVEPNTHRIRVTGRTSGARHGYPKALWFPVHAQLAAQDLDIPASETRTLAAGLFEMDARTQKIVLFNNRSFHFLPEMSKLAPYLYTLLALHDLPDVTLSLMRRREIKFALP
jgi:hypothetical protein